ncbi:cytochrome P450 [Nocardia sp. NPDC046473]|uniref:cytochrome P450 n=1 Tax=Nocardia sp. NPDC046473 TaxID=3155733 RepID=UPI0033D9A082
MPDRGGSLCPLVRGASQDSSRTRFGRGLACAWIRIVCSAIEGKYPAVNEFPYPPGRLPVLGDVLSINPRKPVQSMAKLSEQIGPVYELRFGPMRMVIVNSADLVDVVQSESLWEKEFGPPIRRLRKVVRTGLIVASTDDPQWGAAHRVLMPGFTREAMRGYHVVMVQVAGELIRRWERSSDPVDVAGEMNSMALEVIARAGFGHSFTKLDKPSVEQRLPVVKLMLDVLRYASRPVAIKLLDATIGRFALGRHQRDVAELWRIADDIIDSCPPTAAETPNLLQRMMETPDPNTGQRLSRTVVRDQVLTFLIAGNETSAGTLTFALHALGDRPDIVERVRQEVDTVAGGDPTTLTYEQVQKLQYLRQVVDETLRLWPVAGGYFRRPKQDTHLGDYRIGRGQWVYVNLLAVHRDKRAWGPDADRFDPDRFAPDATPRRPAGAYKPFGIGLRSCIGRQFAIHEIVLTLAHVLCAFDLEPDPKYQLEVDELVTLKPAGLRMRLHPRN